MNTSCQRCDAPITSNDDLGVLTGRQTNRDLIVCEACLEGALDRRVCERCDGPISASDKYARCTDPWGGNVEFICENCRDRSNDREQERLMEYGPGPTLLEQQQAAWRLK